MQEERWQPLAGSSGVTVTRRNLPHWTKENAIYWITFRLADSLPQKKLSEWKTERDLWLLDHPQPWTKSEWREYDSCWNL